MDATPRAEPPRTLADFLAARGVAPGSSSDAPAPLGVNLSDDFERVDALPRRPEWHASPLECAEDAGAIEHELRTLVGTMRLRPVQAAALAEAMTQNGLLAPIGVGQGKTLVDWLLPEVLDSACAVLLVPASLRETVRHAGDDLAKHWRLRRASTHVVSYSELSTAKGADVLERLAPDLIVADEAHYLRHASAARTKRFLRYMAAHPDVRFCALSGTLTTRSLRDWSHLASLALRLGAPVPAAPRALEQWCAALDEEPPPSGRLAPGVLGRWCAPGESVREGYRRRVVETPGVVATTESALGTALEIHARGLKCATIDAAIREVERTGRAPDGTELPDAMHVARVCRALACGFYYVWEWPHGRRDVAWCVARNAWARAVREFLSRADAPAGLDSPLLLANACAREDAPSAELARAWAEWAPQRGKRKPPVSPVWISDKLVRDVARWLSAGEGAGLVWYEHDAVGQRLAAYAQVPWCGPGTSPETLAADEDAALASIAAHGTGKNLQRFARNLIVTPPSSGAAWEQLLARTHRPGQRADAVHVEVYQHTEALRRAFAGARREARYLEESTGQQQKLNLATFAGW